MKIWNAARSIRLRFSMRVSVPCQPGGINIHPIDASVMNNGRHGDE